LLNLPKLKMAELAEKTFSFGDFELSGAKRTLLKGGKTVPLNSKTFDLLQVLIENHGRVLSKDELLEKVWEGQFVEENNLSVQIAALRKVFGERKGEHQFIATIPGKGYKFVHDLNESNGAIIIENRKIERITIDEKTEDGKSGPLRLKSGNDARRRLSFALFALVLLISAIGFFAFRYFRNQPVTQINSLAVLPFANQNAETEYLSDGLAESVTFSLSQVPNLKVMSRNSVFRYKGKDADARIIGSELNVQAVLAGRINQHGDQLDISAELISTADNSVIWGEKFTRKMSDLEKLQNDIAASISGNLRLKISGVKSSETENAEAYQLYLKGLYHWNKRTESDFKQAVEFFQQAIEKDPAYAKAYTGLALTYEVLDANLSMTHAEAVDNELKAKAAAQKALELDGTLAEAHAVLANQKVFEWDFAGAEPFFKRAIELNPNFATAHQWYSEYLSQIGRYDEAVAEVKKAYELDPFSRAVAMNLGLRYMEVRRYDEAVAQFKKLTETEPEYPMSYVFLGDVYLDKKMYEDAFQAWCKGSNLLKIDTPEECEAKAVELRTALKNGGETGLRRKLLEQNLNSYNRRPELETMTLIAAKYAWLGEKERAYEWLEKAFARHENELTYLRVNASFDNMRSDARFKDLLRRIGLPE